MRLIDNTIALRIIYLLVQPIESTDAFKLGIIDRNGDTIRKAKTTKEKNSTSMLHRLCWRIKKVFSLVPGGRTKLGSLAGAYLLVKEALENKLSLSEATDLFEASSNSGFINIVEGTESLNEISETIYDIIERVIRESGGEPIGTTTASLGHTIDLPIFRPLKRKT